MKKEELIALYFEGQLNTDQNTRFEDLLQNDADFKAQVMLEEQLKTVIISTKKDELRNRLKAVEQSKKSPNYYLIAIAASLIITLGVFSLLQPKTVSNDALFAQYFEPYANIIAPAARGDETLDDTSKAFRYYDTKQYKIASENFEALYTKTNTSYFLFYQAVCELQLNHTENAITLFKAHQNYTDKVSNQTHWYLALAHLKANNTKDAKILLQTISTEKSYKHKAADAILKKLK